MMLSQEKDTRALQFIYQKIVDEKIRPCISVKDNKRILPKLKNIFIK